MTPRASEVSFDFRGRAALVTGGTQGIGRAVAEALARAGAGVAVCARTEADVAAAVEALRPLGPGEVCGLTADLADADAPSRLIQDAAARLGPLDVLVNNAAAQGNFPFPAMDLERWRWMAQVNLDAPFELSRRFVLALHARNAGGAIVNVVTNQVVRHAVGRVGYGSTKLGLVGLTRTLALELADSGIRVNAVAPGFVDVERIAREFDDLDDRRAAMPTGRFVRPDEVARAVLFLACDASAAISGVVLPIDGGHHLDGTWVRG